MANPSPFTIKTFYHFRQIIARTTAAGKKKGRIMPYVSSRGRKHAQKSLNECKETEKNLSQGILPGAKM